MSYPVYAFYLIPPPDIVYRLGLGHHLLASEFQARAAGRYMVHATVKGYTRLREGVSPDDILPALDELLANTPPFTTRLTELYTHVGQRGPSVLALLERTPEFHRLHNSVWDIFRPYIAPDCPFSPADYAGPRFTPHLTLAMADLPSEPGLLEQLQALCRTIFQDLPRQPFEARHFQFVRFEAADWEGQWWHNFTYTQLKGWNLPAA